MFHFCQHIVRSKFYVEVSKLWLGLNMLTSRMFCMFFLFYNFWRRLFFLLFDIKLCHVLCKKSYRKGVSFFSFHPLIFTLMFKILLLPITSFRFLFLLYAIIGLSWNAFFSLELIHNKCQCSSVIFLIFGRVLLNCSTSGVLSLVAIFFFFFN